MEHLSPPALTRSPTSPPNELSYPSPPMMAEQQYKIAAFSSGPPCSLPSAYDPELTLPPLDTVNQPGWNTASMHSSSSTSAVPAVVASSYDAFSTPYEPISSSYSQDGYQRSQTSSPSQLGHQEHSPSQETRPTSKSPGPFRPIAKTEPSDYSQPETTRYPSPPRSIATPYVTEASHYSAGTTAPAPGVGSSSYLPESQPGWANSRAEHHPPESATPVYQPASDVSAALMHNRRLSRSSRQVRKAPRRMTTKEEANYQCHYDGCGKLFSRSYNYKAHLETHDKNRAYSFPCPVKDCNKKFVRKTDLQRHNASVHLKERSHKCQYCGRPFARKDTLRRYVYNFWTWFFSFFLSASSNLAFYSGFSMNLFILFLFYFYFFPIMFFFLWPI